MARVPSLLLTVYNWSKLRTVRFILLLLAALWGLNAFIDFLTEAQWHFLQGYGAVWWRGMLTRGLVFLLVFVSIFFIGLKAVQELVVTAPAPRLRRGGLLAQVAVTFAARGGPVACWSTGFIAFFAARRLAGQWLLFAGWSPALQPGERDPFFGLDAAFYLFQLPLYHSLTDSLWHANSWLLLLCALLFAGRYTLDRLARARTTRRARLWVYGLGCCWFVLLALRYYWSQFDLATALHPELQPDGETVRTGIGYVDWYVRRPAAWLGAILSLMAAAMLLRRGLTPLRSTRLRGWRWNGPMKKAFGLIGTACLMPALFSFFGGGFVQRFIVEPNPVLREAPFLHAQDEATRRAWQVPIGVTATKVPSPAAAPAKSPLFPAPRVWDAASLRASLCTNRDDATCPAIIEFDRYPVAGRPALVAVAGYDNDLPVESAVPRVRLFSATLTSGEGKALALEAPQADGSVSLGQHYESGTAALESWFWRLLWAWRLRNLRVLQPQGIGIDDTSIGTIQQAIVARAACTAPFLEPVAEPYPVLEKGRIFWMLDLAVAGARYPGSRAVRLGEGTAALFNLARDSVKMVMEARGGRVSFFAASPAAENEPLLRQWRRAFPTLIQPFTAMPDAVRRHRRYPRRLFAAQLAMLQALERWTPLNTDLEYGMIRAGGHVGETPADLALSTLLEHNGTYRVVSCRCSGEAYGRLEFNDYPAEPVDALLTRLKTIPVPEETAERYFERGPLSVLPDAGRLQLAQPIYAFSLHRNAGVLAGETERQVRLWRLAVGDSATQKVVLRMPHRERLENLSRASGDRAALAREALRLHEAAQKAAANDWQQAAKLWQQLHRVLQRLAEE